jgi:DNA-binding XRE family transcriptional regulator
VAAKAKAGAKLRDARNRLRREERRVIEAWRRLLDPLEHPAVHPTAPRAGATCRKIRAAAGLSIRGLAELSGLTPEGVRTFEASKWGGNYNTFRLICRALRVTVEEFDHWHDGYLPPVWRRRG